MKEPDTGASAIWLRGASGGQPARLAEPGVHQRRPRRAVEARGHEDRAVHAAHVGQPAHLRPQPPTLPRPRPRRTTAVLCRNGHVQRCLPTLLAALRRPPSPGSRGQRADRALHPGTGPSREEPSAGAAHSSLTVYPDSAPFVGLRVRPRLLGRTAALVSGEVAEEARPAQATQVPPLGQSRPYSNTPNRSVPPDRSGGFP